MARRRWLWPVAAAVVCALSILAAFGPLERNRRSDDDGHALFADGWRIRLADDAVTEKMAAREYATHLREYADAGILDNDLYLTEVVGSVATPLIAAARELYPQTRDWPWEWHLADTGEVNAWCLPGGRIMVLSGLLDDSVLGDDRDRLATILAHEVAHAVLHHSRESVGHAWAAQGLAWTVAKSLKIGAMRESRLTSALKTALLDPRTRARETEADTLGLELMARAGFSPAKAVETWERMAERQAPAARTPTAQRALAFLGDHPSDSERLERLRRLYPQAQPLADSSQKWDWMTHALDPEQSEALSRAANAFGLDRLTLAEDRKLVAAFAAAEHLSTARASSEIEQAMWETALDPGGALQLGLSAMVHVIGGWDRLNRVETAWSKLRHAKPLLEDPEQIKRLALSEEDRAVTQTTIRRLAAYLAAPRTQRRLWRDAAEELGKTMPKGRQAILDRLEEAS